MRLGRGLVLAGGPVRRRVDGAVGLPARGSIDPSPFVDATGTLWLLWKSEATATAPTTIWSQPLSANGLKFEPASTPTALLTPAQSWEHHVVEAPSMIGDPRRRLPLLLRRRLDDGGIRRGSRRVRQPRGPVSPHPLGAGARVDRPARRPGRRGRVHDGDGAVWLAYHAFTQPDVGYPNSRTLHFATVRIIGGIPVVTPQ